MATTKLYLDTRATKRGEPAPLKLSITKHGVAAYIPLDIKVLPTQWDKEKGKVKDNPNKASLNNFISSQKQKIDNILFQLTSEGKITKMTSVQIKRCILDILNPKVENDSLFLTRFQKYMESRTKQRTKELYNETFKRIKQFDKKASILSFESITKDWLQSFDKFLQKYESSQNSRSIHFRNIRAVFNDAIDNEITTAYPFRKFMVRPTETKKRAIKVEVLRDLMNYPVLPHQQKYVDIFMLIFYLIGINAVDLFNLTEIIDDRIVYNRSKTSKLYSIKVEPEALSIIEKYRGCKKLLIFAERSQNTHSFLRMIDRGLKQIGTREHVIVNGKKKLVYHSAFPNLTTYVARHTWATIAAELEIPNETIAAALGHSFGNKTTSIYIDKNMKKIDEANRAVIDYVLEAVESKP